MAAIGMIIGGPIVNALAFTAGNYLFSLLGRSDEARNEENATIWPLKHSIALCPSTSTSAGCGWTT